MPLEIKLTPKLTYKLRLSPQMRLSLNLLQLPLVKLKEYVIEQIEKNPLLESVGSDSMPIDKQISVIDSEQEGMVSETTWSEEDEEKAPYIKRAFSLMSSGSYSLRMLANTLYNEGFRGRKSNRVGISAIDHFLKNPIYYGAFRWKKGIYQGSHTPLISKELFDKTQEVLTDNFHPCLHKRQFYFNNLMRCGICGCKVLGEITKNKYKYYHCTFSKGRHKEIEYIREEKLVRLFEEPIAKITLPDEIAEWLKKGMRELSKDTLQLQDNRLNSLKTQYEKVNSRLNRLYDSKFDGEIDEDVFKAKEEEYKTQLIEIKSRMNSSQAINPDLYEYAFKTFELSNRLHSLYVREDYENKAKLLKFIASNYTLNNATPCPTYRKPFDIIAKGLSRSNWLPFVKEYRTALMELKPFEDEFLASVPLEFAL